MMRLAQDRDGIAKMFDPLPRHMPQLPQNNYLFERVEVKGHDTEGSRASSRMDGQSPLPASAKDKPVTATPNSNVKERLRSLQRVWTAMTKFLASQCGNGRTVDLPLAGKFKKVNKASED